MQIHQITAKRINVSQNKEGFYSCSAAKKISLLEHTEILMQVQSELKEHYSDMIDFWRKQYENTLPENSF